MAKKNRLLKTPGLILFLIVLFGLALRLIFFSGMGYSDDQYYSKYSYTLGDGTDPNTLAVRIGILYATHFFYGILGVNDFSSVFFVLLSSIAGIILIYYFGKLLFDEKTGLLSAFLLSVFPLHLVYSTKLVTDIPSAFFMSLGVYVFLNCELKQKSRINYFLSGLLIGIGYLIRESALLIGLFFIVYIIYKKPIKKEYFLIPLGILIIFIIESLLFYSLTGHLSFRFTSSQQWLVEAYAKYDYFGRLSLPMGLFHYPYLLLTNSLLLYFSIFIFIAAAYCIAYKKRETYTLLFWLLPLLIYLSFGSSGITKYLPFRAVDRYLEVIAFPGVLLLAYFLKEKNELIRKVLMPAALVLLVIASIGAVYLRDDRHLLDGLKAAYPFLEKGGKLVYTDSRSVKALDYISGFENSVAAREYPADLGKAKDAYIVINQNAISNVRKVHTSPKFPEEIEKIPKSWSLVKEFGKTNGSKVLVYYAQ